MPRKETMPVKPPRPYYVPVANEEQVFKAAYRQGLSVVLKGPTGCGKTRFVEAMAHDLDRPLDHRLLPRRPDHRRPRRPLPAARRRHGMGRRPADACGARRRDLLSRRGRRGPPGHHGGAASAGRPPAAAADRAARGHARRGARLLPRGVVQPRLPERAEGPQGLDAPADGRHRVRFPHTGGRGEDRRQRGGHRTTNALPNSCGSARRSAGWKPAGCARWRRRAC